MSIIPECEQPPHPRGRQLTATQCALAIVTAGLGVAAAMLALIMSANTAQATQLPDSDVTQYRQGSVFAQIESEPASTRQGSVFSQFQPQTGPYRQASVFTAFQPQPSPTFTPFPQPSPSPVPGPWLPSMSMPAGGTWQLPDMPMPVIGTWQVTCGYRCGLHTAANNATFALDIVSLEGNTAGQPVRSPVEGQIVAVTDSATYYCNGQWTYGPSGGSGIAIDSQDATGTTWRLRLFHLDATTISDDLRPNGAPVWVKAGTFLGNLAPLDGCAHLHMALTRLDKAGEIPQPLVIDGQPLDDCATQHCWLGTQLPSQSS